MKKFTRKKKNLKPQLVGNLSNLEMLWSFCQESIEEEELLL